MKMIDRRVFFRFLGAGAAGITVAPSLLRSCTSNGNGNEDTYVNFDGIMPIAMVADCSRLLLASGKLSDPVKMALTADINLPLPGNLSRLGSSLPFDDENIFSALQGLGVLHEQDSELKTKKLSLILGWIIFRPLKKSMTDVFRKLVEEGYHFDNIRSYFDAYLLRQYSGYHENPGASKAGMQELLQELLPRMITRLHTLKPDYKDGMEWVNRMSEWRKENIQRMDRYGALLVEDDRELFDHAIRKYNVYNPEDSLIGLVRSMGSNTSAETVEQVILSDPGNSIYSKSLLRGYNNVITVQEYLDAGIDLNKMKKML